MIFGGYTEENQGSNQCFSITVNDKQAILKNELCSLPLAEGFWNNNPIIYKGNVHNLIITKRYLPYKTQRMNKGKIV
jgi:hypothetical protein